MTPKTKPDIWMPIYCGDYIKDTRSLKAEEHGAYFLLMIEAWMNEGYIDDDPHRLSIITGIPYDRLNHVITKFWTKGENGKLFQKRLLEEYAKSVQRSESARANITKRWQHDTAVLPPNMPPYNGGNTADNTDDHTESIRNGYSSPSPSPSPEDNSNKGITVDRGSGGNDFPLKLEAQTPPKPKTVTTEQWLDALTKDPACQGINVMNEWHKMNLWCKTHKKQPTQRRFVNWLSRCDRTISTAIKSQDFTGDGTEKFLNQP